MSLLRLPNGKVNYLTYVVTTCLVLWVALIVSSFFIPDGADRISVIAAQVEFVVHAFTLLFLVFICMKLKFGGDRKEVYWILAISIMLFIVDFCFYIAAYANDSFLLQLSVLQFFLYYFPCIVGAFMMIIFIANILLRDVLQTRNFLKVLTGLILINLVTMALFLSSIHDAFKVISWDTISQIFTLAEELIMFDFAILGLIYAQNNNARFLLSGMITLVASDYFFTYSYISQTVKLFSYGELFWLLGLLFIFFAVFRMIQYQDYAVTKWFNKSNKIGSSVAFWTFCISISGFLLFFIIAYAFEIVSKAIFAGLPLFVMMFSVIAVVLSIFVGKNFEAPFKKIANNIDALMIQNDKTKIDDDFSIEEFIFLQKYIVDTYEFKEEKDRIKKKIGDIAVQVAHDIRSPLTALNVSLQHLPQIPEDQRIALRNASNRINDIANNLLEQYKAPEADSEKNSKRLQVWLLAPLVDSIISEKRLQFEGRPIELNIENSSEGFSAFSKINAHDMKRLLSNLINNSAEAFSDKGGNITVLLDADSEHFFLKIKDNGSGIPKDKLEEVLKPGVSFKEKGMGLGLPHAKQTIESWGGSLSLESVEGQGTTVSITLPRASAPSWFVSKILISPRSTIAILDDDQSVHNAWDQRLQDVSKELKIHHFKTPQSFRDWFAKQKTVPVRIFSDYELLGESETGLDVLESLGLKGATLVTSHYENPEIISRCVKIGVGLLPKSLLAHIPIEKRENTKRRNTQVDFKNLDLILVDDNEVLRQSWELRATVNGKSIMCFESIEEFEEALPMIDRKTAVYMDSDLGDHIKGEEYTKSLAEKGFTEIYLATGHPASYFAPMPWVRKIIGKEPPF